MGAIARLVDNYVIYPILDTVGDVLGEIPFVGPILEDVQEFATHEVYGGAREIVDSIDAMIPDDLKMIAATVAAVVLAPATGGTSLVWLPAVVSAANAADQAAEAGASDGQILGAALRAGVTTAAISYATAGVGSYVGSGVAAQTGSQVAGRIAASVAAGAVAGAAKAAIYGQDIGKAALTGAAMGGAGAGLSASFAGIRTEFNDFLTPEDFSGFDDVDFGDGFSDASISADIRSSLSGASETFGELPEVVQDILGSAVKSTIATSLRAGEFELADMKDIAAGAIARAAATSDTFKEVIGSSDLNLNRAQQAQLTEILYAGAVTAATGGDAVRAMGSVGLKISAREAKNIMAALTAPELTARTEELSGITAKESKLVQDVNTTADTANNLSERIITAAATITDKTDPYVALVDEYNRIIEAGGGGTGPAKELLIRIEAEEAWFDTPEYLGLSIQLERDLATQEAARAKYTALMSEFPGVQDSLAITNTAYEREWSSAKETTGRIIDRSVVSNAISTVVKNPESVSSEVPTAFIDFAVGVGGVTKDFGNEDLSPEEVTLAQDIFTSGAAQAWLADDPEIMESWGYFLETPSSDAAVYFGDEDLSQEDISQYIDSNTVTRKEVTEKFAEAGISDLSTYEQQRAAWFASLGGAAYDPTATNAISRETDWLLGDPNSPGSYVYNDNRARAANRGLSPFDTSLKVFIGGRPQEETFERIDQYADPLVTTGAEAQEFFETYGYVPTQSDIDQFSGEFSEVTQKEAIGEFVDPRQYTRDEVREALSSQGITDPTNEELDRFVAQSSDPTFQTTQAQAAADYWNPLGVTEDEVRQTFETDYGFTNYRPEDLSLFTGRVPSSGPSLSERVAPRIPGMVSAATLADQQNTMLLLALSGQPQQQQQAVTPEPPEREWYAYDPYGDSILPPTQNTKTAAGGGLIEDKTDEILRILGRN